MIPLALGYLGVVSVWRAWDRDETRRAAIIRKKESEAKPDASPDLRCLAVISALQLVILFPLISWKLHEDCGCLPNSGHVGFHNWVVFAAESLCRALFDPSRLLGTAGADVQPSGLIDQGFVFIQRVAFAWILVQGLLRTFQISHAVREAVEVAVKRDNYNELRLVGRRAVPLLLAQEDPSDKVSDYRALGDLSDSRATIALLRAVSVETGDERATAADSLGRIAEAEAMHGARFVLDATWKAFQGTTDSWQRVALVKAMGRSRDARAIPKLKTIAIEQQGNVATAAVKALAEIGDEASADPLLHIFGERPPLRVQARQSLDTLAGAIAKPDAVSGWLARIWTDKKKAIDVRESAIREFAESSAPCVYVELVRIADDNALEEELRVAALNSLDNDRFWRAKGTVLTSGFVRWLCSQCKGVQERARRSLEARLKVADDDEKRIIDEALRDGNRPRS